jgi:hypothetical protein
VSNPGKTDWQAQRLFLGYAPEDDTSIVRIDEIPLSLAAGGVFEQDVPWKVDFQPKAGVKYQLRLMLLSADGTSLGEALTAVEFVQPRLEVTVDADRLAQNSQVTIHVRAGNPSGIDMHAFKLLLGVGTEDDTSMVQISELPLSLAAGQDFEQDFPWNVDFQSTAGIQYKLRLLLLSPEDVTVAETSIPIEFVGPELTLTVNPAQLKKNARATIDIRVSNPSDTDWVGYTLTLGYAAVNDSSSYLIQQIPLALKAGETFTQEITWTVDTVPAAGDYEVRADILSPDNVVLIEISTPITLSAP